MAKMTLEHMEAVLNAHETAEFNNDLEAVMATLVDNPVFELPAVGLRLEGQDAIREMYRRFLGAGDKLNIWADRRVHAISDNELVREAFVYFDTPEGRVTGQYCVVLTFEGDKLVGERFYMDSSFAEVMGEALGDILTLPGVTRLVDSNPPPVPRLDRAAAHAASSSH